MEAYPSEYVSHSLPLIVLSGLEAPEEPALAAPSVSLLEDGGRTITSDQPLVGGETAQHLLREFGNADGTKAAWNNRPGRLKGDLIGFKFRAVGRSFTLPRRKANPPMPLSPTFSPSDTNATSPTALVLHSPISPLSPGSPVFPDGVITPLWIAKHQHFLPSVFVVFYNFMSDPSRNSLHDNQLKNDFNNIRTVFHKLDYKTRLVVVLLSDTTILDSPEIEERLANIRRATGLDPKSSLFFLPPDASPVEITSFVMSILTTVQPMCIEYYRDLTKHARRKKNRSTIPLPTAPPTRGTSQILQAHGWGIRYEFKLGVLAEFRQEMDAAGRHYTFAFDALLASDGILETTPSWSPRWDDARMLADIIAFRIIRCLLWNHAPTSAVQSWVNHRDAMRELLDRRGKGSSNYGWEAWESRWAKIMAELVNRAELPVFSPAKASSSIDAAMMQGTNAVYAPAEKAIPLGERLPPWQLLHHAGYWLKLAVNHAFARWKLANDIPDEDRVAPNQSPAAQVSARNSRYDTYLCPEPHMENALPDNGQGFDHTEQLTSLLDICSFEFQIRRQQRFVDMLQLQVGKELLRVRQYKEARDVLKPLWQRMNWRKERWWDLVYQTAWTLYKCAKETSDVATLVSAQWELMSRKLQKGADETYDLMHCTDALPKVPVGDESKPQIFLKEESITSFLSASCNFATAQSHVGEPLSVQVAITSNAHEGSESIILSSIKVHLEGNLRQLELRHQTDNPPSDSDSKSQIVSLTVREASIGSLSGTADLTLYPGQTKVYSFPVIFREAGPVNVFNIDLSIDTNTFELQYNTSGNTDVTSVWWLELRDGLRKKRLTREDEVTLNVLPKPPKMEIRLPNLQEQYYVDERITLDVELSNMEDEDTEITLEARFKTRSRHAPQIDWGSETLPPRPATLTLAPEIEASPVRSPRHDVGKIEKGASTHVPMTFQGTWEASSHILEIKVLYHTVTDPETPISKTFSTPFTFDTPFEADYSFLPRIHPAPWPSFFSADNIDQPVDHDEQIELVEKEAKGLTHRWHLGTEIKSVADEDLIIHGVEVEQHTVTGGLICSQVERLRSEEETTIGPRSSHTRGFLLDLQKHDLDDRRSATLDLNLVLQWRRRTGTDPENTSHTTTTLSIPRLMVPNLEPRVLCSASKPSPPDSAPPRLITLVYTFENPSQHFLTFELTMDTSEDFAFSGPKTRSLNVLPVSRREVKFVVLPMGEAEELRPQLRVVDRYFNKVLKVLGGEGCRVEKGGSWCVSIDKVGIDDADK